MLKKGEETMTDQLRLGTLGDEIFQAGPSIPLGDPFQGGISIPTPLQTGGSIPIPLAGDGMTVPIPAFAAGDDLPIPPIPLYGDDLAILQSGITIPIP
jgi:hypothetical protein